jgi:hypothetical protein
MQGGASGQSCEAPAAMSWWAIIYGELRLPIENETAWRTLTIHPADWNDWPKELYIEHVKPVNVGKLLASVESYGKDAWVHLHREGALLRVVGLLHEDAFRDVSREIAVALRGASKVGATGDAYIGNDQMWDFAWRVRLTAKGSTIRRPSRSAVERVLPEALDHVERESRRVQGGLQVKQLKVFPSR